jgi:hypothetical protein
MIILGVDPGIKNTGLCVLDGGKPVFATTVVLPQRSKVLVMEVLQCVLPILNATITKYGPSVTVVEEVTWYGRSRRAMLPLAIVAGAIVGTSIARNVPTFLLLAAMRSKIKRLPRKWTEHERDAARLAYRMNEWFALPVEKRSNLQRRLVGTLTSSTTRALSKRS